MTRPGGHRKTRRGPTGRAASTASIDGGVYSVLAILGLAIMAGAFLLGEGASATGPALLAYVALLAIVTNLSAIAAYRGRPLARWKQALARLPLRPAGYGRRGGKPLEAAHDVPAVRRAVVVSVAVSLLLLVALTLVLVPALRPF